MRLDELELALAETGQVQELVHGDVLLDRAEDHPRRADQLVDTEVLEQVFVFRVVDAGDRARHVEVVLRHLADDKVVLVVAGHCRHDVSPVRARLAEVLALAAIVGDHDRPDLVGDLVGPRTVLLHQDDFVAGLDQLLGQVIADLATANDQNEHRLRLPARVRLGRRCTDRLASEPDGTAPDPGPQPVALMVMLTAGADAGWRHDTP